jgi:hypothetical protein
MDFLFGLAKNERLIAAIAPELERAACQEPAQRPAGASLQELHVEDAHDLEPQASCRCQGRVHARRANSRFVVTLLTREECKPKYLYEQSTAPAATWRTGSRSVSSISMQIGPRRPRCGPTSCALWFHSMAYVLLCALRRIGLPDTDFARVTCGTIRLKPLKIGALVRISARRIRIAMASACPVAREWARAGSPSRRSPRLTA